jgi:hypothetical protein
MHKTIRLLGIIAFLSLAGCASLEQGYQHDADIFRLKHLEYYGNLIEEYHQKTGKYPLQGECDTQHYVLIAAPYQQKYAQGTPPQFKVTDIERFRDVLEEGLGREVRFKFDPQKVPTGAPNFYIYMVQDDVYFFAIHLNQEFPFTNPIAKHYNKMEITNNPFARGQWKFRDLLANQSFLEAINEAPDKNGWFLHLEEKYY